MAKLMIKIKWAKSLEENLYRREYQADELCDFAEFLMLIHNISQDFGKPRHSSRIGHTEIYTSPGHIWPSVIVSIRGSKDAIDIFDKAISRSIEES